MQGIGLSGQMHGATLLDSRDRVLRPAILWNDGRSVAECGELEAREPDSRRITGNLAMPGFTAPKLIWVAGNKPEVFANTAGVLLPKDYVRLRMTGERVSEMSDASGTLWLDVAARDWSDSMLAATGLSRDHMPRLVEGSEPGGALLAAVAAQWGVPARVPVAGGAGDNAASAAGIGAVAPSSGFLSLGTSGVLFVSNAAFSPNPDQAVHAFCHCLPGTWHQMSVILSAASCLKWVAALTGAADEASLLEEVEAAGTFPATSCSSRTSRANGRRTTIRRRWGCSSASRTTSTAPHWRGPCWRVSPSRSPTARTPCSSPEPKSMRSRWLEDVRGAGTGAASWRRCWGGLSTTTSAARSVRRSVPRGWHDSP